MIHTLIALLLFLVALSIDTPMRYYIQVKRDEKWVDVHTCGSRKLAAVRVQQFRAEIARSSFRVVAV